MIYDEETGHWYINETHMKHSKAALESNARLQQRLPLDHNKVLEQAARWNAMGENK